MAERSKQRLIFAAVILCWAALSSIPIIGGGVFGLGGIMKSALMLLFGFTALLFAKLVVFERDPVARGILVFAAETGITAAFTLAAWFLFVLLMISEIEFPSKGTVPEIVLEQHPSRMLTPGEGLLLTLVFSDAFAGASLLMAVNRWFPRGNSANRKVPHWHRAVPNIGPLLKRIMKFSESNALKIGSVLFFIMIFLNLFGKSEEWTSFVFIHYSRPSLLVVGAVSLLTLLCLFLSVLVAMPLRVILLTRMIFRMATA